MKQIKFLTLVVSLLSPLVALHASAEASPVQLRMNDIDAPIGLDAGDVASLRFGWVIDTPQRAFTQSGYQILVASNPQALDNDKGDMWDSGKVTSPRQNGIAYAGKPLAGKTACWWKVRIWDSDGKSGDWSQPATFETGIVNAEKDWNGKFVGGLDAKTKSSFN